MRVSLVARLTSVVALSVGVLGIAAAGTAAAANHAAVGAASSATRPTAPQLGQPAAAAIPARSDIRAAGGTQPVALTATQLRFDHRHGIVPLRGANAAPTGSVPRGAPRGALPCENACNVQMSYFGGPVISNAQVEGVFWGGGNYTAGAGPGGEMPSFYNAVGASDYWNGLTPDYSTVGIGGSTNQVIGPVTSLGETTITPSAPNNGAVITDSQMQNELAMQLNSSALPAPTLDSTGNVNTLYALYFPDSKIVCLDNAMTQCSNNVFCAYHSTMSYNGMDVPYMVLPADTPGSPEATGCGALPSLTDNYTSTVSHELVEATTDTAVGLVVGPNYAFPAAWGDNNFNVGEVMDACDTGVAANDAQLPNTTFYVQAIWSNQQNQCEFSRPYLNISPASATTLAGHGVAYTATALGPTDVTGSTTFSISPAVAGASCTGNSCSATQAGSYTVTGTDGGLGLVSLAVPLTVTGTQCQPGTYSVTGDAPCTNAPPGSFVAGAGATSATPCGFGFFAHNSGQTACDPAPPGSYVDQTGATAPKLCPAGTYNPNFGAASQIACLPAPFGTFVNFPGAAQPEPCGIGTYQPNTGQTHCIPAPPGTYVATTHSGGPPTPCPAGTFNPMTGSTSATACLPAPVGYFVSSPGSASATACPVGTFQPVTGQTVCPTAPAGTYVDTPASAAFTNCPAGTYNPSTGSTSAAACLPAPVGTYAANPGSANPTNCLLGTYQPLTGQTQCIIAPPGAYVDTTGSATATSCPAGTYDPNAGSTSAAACLVTPAGTYVDTSGSAAPTSCPAGTYNPNTGSTSASACLAAPAGTYVPNPGAAAPTSCAAGSYSPSTGATSCTKASPGSYVPHTGSTAQTPCAAGTYSASSGASACTSADPGSHVATPGSSGEAKCPAGSFSASSGAVTCTAAPPGSYVAGVGATGAVTCGLGTFSPGSGATSCLLAPLNTYVDTTGASFPIGCPAHTYTAHTGSTSQSACRHLVITTTALPGGTLFSVSGRTYSTTLTAKGGTRPYAWSIVTGKLPPGLKLSSSTGAMTGKATTIGTFTFTVKVHDTATSTHPRYTATATLSITISR